MRGEEEEGYWITDKILTHKLTQVLTIPCKKQKLWCLLGTNIKGKPGKVKR